MKRLALLLLALGLAPLVAQENPLMSKLAAHWKTSKEFTIAVANQMPAENYSFKPNPEQMSFGEQMAHIAGANAYFYALMNGDKPPSSEKPANFEKATVVKMLNDSFDSTAKILSQATPEQLHKTYKTPDGEMTGFELILFAMDHTTHHRGQCEVYLRVKNIKPTDYRF
jgi:uncharacterized damage-inducible protein DinB